MQMMHGYFFFYVKAKLFLVIRVYSLQELLDDLHSQSHNIEPYFADFLNINLYMSISQQKHYTTNINCLHQMQCQNGTHLIILQQN